MVKDCGAFVTGELDAALLEDTYGAARMLTPAYLSAAQACLAKVMAESYQDDTLTRNANEIIDQHAVEDLQRVHHESVLTLMMLVALGCREVVTVLYKLDEVIYALAINL